MIEKTHAIIVSGSPVILARTTYTNGNVNYSAGTLDAMPRAEKLALGVYEVVKTPPPEGQQALSWSYAVTGDVVTATPTYGPTPPKLTLETLAAAIAPPAVDGEGLVVGRWYSTGQTVVVEGTTYDVIQPFLYANSEWTVQSLAAHLVAAPTSVWAPSTAYTVGAEVTHNGTSYTCLQAHTSQVGWEPPNVPALWAVA